MKKLIVVALISLIGYTSSAQAKISFKNETVDYGKIVKGSDGVRVFEFTNTGDAELVVTNVKSSCGCTVPKKPEGPLPFAWICGSLICFASSVLHVAIDSSPLLFVQFFGFTVRTVHNHFPFLDAIS